MSGTSQDGVDIALIETDGEVITRFGATAYRTYSFTSRGILFFWRKHLSVTLRCEPCEPRRMTSNRQASPISRRIPRPSFCNGRSPDRAKRDPG
jgi:hypothetical protein